MKKLVAMFMTMALALFLLAGCGGSSSTNTEETQETPATSTESVAEVEEATEGAAEEAAEEVAPLPEPEHASKPMPKDAKTITLKEGELLFTASVDYPQAKKSLFAFVLSADGKTVTSFTYELKKAKTTNIRNGKPADTFRGDITSPPGTAEYAVDNGTLAINTDTYDLVLTFDGETAEGTINFHYYFGGVTFDDSLKIQGMEYPDDVPPSKADYGESPVVFKVAKRG